MAKPVQRVLVACSRQDSGGSQESIRRLSVATALGAMLSVVQRSVSDLIARIKTKRSVAVLRG